MRSKASAILILAGLTWSTSSALAGVTYQYVTDQSSYTANAGSTVTVSLFLNEILTVGSSSIINTDGGQFGAGVGVNQSGSVPSNATIVTDISFNTAAVSSGGFGTPATGQDIKNIASDHSNAALTENIGSSSTGIAATQISNSNGTIVNQILLGTATLTAGAAGTTTTFQITSLKNSPNAALGLGNEGNTLTLNSGWDLDLSDNGGQNSFITGASPPTYVGANDVSINFSVTAVPEPSSILLCGLAVCGGAFGAYRRRKAVAASGLALGAWRRWRKQVSGKV